jgi:hypothetical protein
VDSKQVKIVRINPDNVRLLPANDFLISHTRDEFFLTFSSIEPPSVMEQIDLENLEQVEAIARVKLVVTPQFAEAMLAALTINIESFKKDAEPDDTQN